MMRRAFIQFTRGRVGCGVVAGCKGAAHQSVAHRCAFRRSRNPGEQPWRSQKIIRGARLRGGRERCLRRPVGGRMDRAVAGARRRARRAWRGCADHGRLRGNASREAGIRFECDRVSGPSYPVEEGLISSFARPLPIFPYCRSRPVRRSSTSAAEWFPDASFDGAYAQHVTMNVPDRFRFFAEACRVVRTGGFFALSRCLSPSDRQLPEGPSSCSRQVRSRLPQRHRGGSPFIQQTAISRRLSTVRYAANRTGRMEGEMTAAPAPMSAT